MAIGIKTDRVKSIPVTQISLPEEYEPLFQEEEVIGCFKGLRDLIVFTDIRIVSIDVQGITGKQKVIITIPYRQICEMMIETAGYLDVDTDLVIRTTGGTSMAYSFHKGDAVIRIQN
ncbi:MAG: PH domain-containing protein [Holdemanella porci]